MKTLKAAKRTLARIMRLARLCSGGPGAAAGVLLCLLILSANLAGVYVGTLFIAWNKSFFDALESVAVDETIRQVGIFFSLAFASAALFLSGQYIRKLVYIRWRTRLNAVILDGWLSDHTYWRLQPGITPSAIDNPDQRIAEDCRLFVDALLEQTIELVTKLVALVTFLWVLWGLSSFPLEFTLLGIDVYIPRYMVWAAFIYVALSSILTHALGAPLKGLLFRQQQREADYRFALARLRDASDSVALSAGEAAERRILDKRFSSIIANWHRVIAREFILGCFTRPYFQTVLRIPMFLALPAYLAGRVTLGGLMQVGSAFSSVVTTLSWFIFSYRELADWVATTDRLAGLIDSIEAARAAKSGIGVIAHDRDTLTVCGLELETPGGRRLNLPKSLEVRRGEHVWLRGPSGRGKSTLLKAVAGIWMHGTGTIRHPRAWRPAFVSQSVYLPLAGLFESAVYPADASGISETEMHRIVSRVGLGGRLTPPMPAPDATDVTGLSGGEKQRLALARILAARPDWIFLDETTNALDEPAVHDLLNNVLNALPQATLVVVAHTEPGGNIKWREIDLGDPGQDPPPIRPSPAGRTRLPQPP